jgi:hypothetical protein
VVPAPAVPGAAAGVVVHAGHAGEHRGVRAGRRGRQVRDAPLPLHLHQRQGAAQRALLLARVADVGGRGRAARVAEVQAPKDARVAVLHPTAAAAVAVLVAGGGEAPPLHRAAHLAQAQPGRPAVIAEATACVWSLNKRHAYTVVRAAGSGRTVGAKCNRLLL